MVRSRRPAEAYAELEGRGGVLDGGAGGRLQADPRLGCTPPGAPKRQRAAGELFATGCIGNQFASALTSFAHSVGVFITV